MTGDIFDYANEPLEIKARAKLFLQELSKISPVFMVLGNHDLALPAKGRKRSFSDEGYNFLKQVEKETENFHLLDNKWYQNEDFVIGGHQSSNEYWCDDQRVREPANVIQAELEKFLKKAPKNNFKPKFLMTHSPANGDILLDLCSDFDLIITGHMHNGLLPSFCLGKNPKKSARQTIGMVGPFHSLFTKYTHGQYKNLLISSPVTTLSRMPTLQKIYPRYLTELKFEKAN